jgi:GTP-binding protein EngB required for normal cell division
MDGQFAEIEAVLAAIGAESPLSQYTLDLPPMQRKVIGDHLQRIRREMGSILKRLDISPDGRRVSAAWSIQCRLIGVSIAIAEMEPSHLRGYGNLDPQSSAEIARFCGELERLVSSLDVYLRRAQGEDLSQRLSRLDGSPFDREVLATLERIITNRGFLELRPLLEAIVSRIESAQFEIAFFGRVSSGKSSLLNFILGHDVLPVGVTPVTAVPTRLRGGNKAEMVVTFEISSPQRLPVERIGEFVTEEGNPRNSRHVAGVEVFFPSPRLADGVVFVDTPGVGSLATCGAAQTMAYLPRCDLGVVLVDAGSSLNQEDLTILQALHEAAVPAMVLVSKADLLTDADRQRVLTYIEHHVKEALGLDLKAHPVSTVGSATGLTDAWLASRIAPTLENRRQLARASIQRKIVNLRELVIHTLSSLIAQRQGRPASPRRTDAPKAAQLLEAASVQIARVEQRNHDPVDAGLAATIDRVAKRAAIRTVRWARMGTGAGGLLAAFTFRAIVRSASAARAELIELGGFLARTIRALAEAFPDVSADYVEDATATLGALPPVQETDLAEIPNVRPSLLLSWWPALACWAFRRRVRRECWWAIDSVLRQHQHRLRSWRKTNLERVVAAYEARAGLYREQLRRAEGQTAPDAAGVAELQADLDLVLNVESGAADADSAATASESVTTLKGTTMPVATT